MSLSRFAVSSKQTSAPTQWSKKGVLAPSHQPVPRDQSMEYPRSSCGGTVSRRVTKKEGANQGREFYTCSCGNGFAWVDECEDEVHCRQPRETAQRATERSSYQEPEASFQPSIFSPWMALPMTWTQAVRDDSFCGGLANWDLKALVDHTAAQYVEQLMALAHEMGNQPQEQSLPQAETMATEEELMKDVELVRVDAVGKGKEKDKSASARRWKQK